MSWHEPELSEKDWSQALERRRSARSTSSRRSARLLGARRGRGPGRRRLRDRRLPLRRAARRRRPTAGWSSSRSRTTGDRTRDWETLLEEIADGGLAADPGGARAARPRPPPARRSTSRAGCKDFDLPLDWRLTRGFPARRCTQSRASPTARRSATARSPAKAGNPRAFRAAGTACGANPLPLIVPCHRVAPGGRRLGQLRRRAGDEEGAAGAGGRAELSSGESRLQSQPLRCSSTSPPSPD